MEGDIQAQLIQPLTTEQVEMVAYVYAVTLLIASVAVIISIICAGTICFKTKLPGRYLVFFSSILFAAFFAFTHYMGGDLEYVFGIEGQLYEGIAYSLILIIFSVGLLRVCIGALRK